MPTLIDEPVLALTRDDAYRLVGPLSVGLRETYPDGVPDDLADLVAELTTLALREVAQPEEDLGFVTLEEAAAVLQCSIKTVRRRIKTGQLPAALDRHGMYLVAVEDLAG